MFEITDALHRLNLQYVKNSAMDSKYIKKSICHDDNKYTHWKLPIQTWEEYFTIMKEPDDTIHVDCRIAIELVRLFNDPTLSESNIFTIEFPSSGLDHEEYIFVGDRFDVALAPYIASHRGIWVVPSKNKGMYIGLADKGFNEKSQDEWKKFIHDIYEENFIKFISKEEFINRKSKFYRRCCDDYHHYISNPEVTKLSVTIGDNHMSMAMDDGNYLGVPKMKVPFLLGISQIEFFLKNGLSMTLYSLDGTSFEIDKSKDIIMIASILPNGDDEMNFSSFIRSIW